ncbi:MAG: glycosyltransferase family 2 protein, partial [Nitriliruptoraceae bacterium]
MLKRPSSGTEVVSRGSVPTDGSTLSLPPLPDAPTVSVIIPARNGAATLPDAVASVLAQSPSPDEVVIAVAPSTDATYAVATTLVRDHPERVRMVDNPSGRTPDALNAAIAAVRGQVLARVDTGAVLPPGYLRRAVEVLRETGAANVGGLQVPHADRGFGAAVAAAMRSPVGSGGAAYRSGARSGPVDTVYLGVFRREALEAVGGFDPAFVRNQDAELNLRLRAAGYTVWLEPELQVTYRPRGSVRGLAAQYLQYGRYRRRTAATHPRSLAPRQLAPVALVVGLAGAVGWSLLR